MNNVIKGLLYEKHVKDELLKSNTCVYLWNDIPIDIFIKSNIFESYLDKLKFMRNSKTELHNVSDTGCDIFYLHEQTNKWIIVQCKNYSHTIIQAKLAGFYDLVLSTGLHGELYYTSSLSEVVTRYIKKTIKFIHFPFATVARTTITDKLIPVSYTHLTLPTIYSV